MKLKRKNFTIPALLFISFFTYAQNQGASSNDVLTKKRREAIVKRVATEFRNEYVFADVGEKMAAFIEQKFNDRAYDSITIQQKFTAQLERDMQSISKDKHIKIRTGEAPTDFEDLNILRKENFGFKTAEILPGNIGYLDFFQFYPPKFAAPTVIAAMNFLAHCDALIVDLRENGGGYTELRKLMCSYFFDEPVSLIEFRNSRGVLSIDSTSLKVSGPKLSKTPIYVLVSPVSFSCAEDFSFCLQNLKRATVIGQRTKGGAHDSKILSFPSESLFIQMPFSEAVDPITKKTWEGVGIEPDIIVESKKAKQVAMIEATKGLLKKNQQDKYWTYLWKWVQEDYEVQLNPIKLSFKILGEYAGQYGSYQIMVENDYLVSQYKSYSKERLIPLGNDGFKVVEDGKTYSKYRVQFIRDKSGKIIGLYYHDHDGDGYGIQKKNVN